MSRAEESEHQQLTRNLNELLQEVRVAQAGVQILFGFLLSIAFTDRYARSGADVKAIHLVTVLFAVIAVALLIAPVAYHRILFRFGRREEIIRFSDRFAQAGLISLAVAMSGTVLLLTQVAIGPWASIPAAVLIALGFALLWFVFPARHRRRGPQRERVQPSQPNPPSDRRLV